MKELTKKIKDYSTACKHLKRAELTIKDFSFLPQSQQDNAFARHVFLTCKEAVIGDYKPDYSDYDTWRYEIYGYNENSGFSFICVYVFLNVIAGSDFVFPDSQSAKYLIEICKPQLKVIYK